MKDIAHSEGQIPENIGVANPYALADLVSGKDLAWDKIEDRKAVLSEVLESPYEELFDPCYQSPLYTGLALGDDMSMHKDTPRPSEIDLTKDISDEQISDAFERDPDVSALNSLADLKDYIQNRPLEDLELLNPEILSPGILRFELKLTNIPSRYIAFPAKAQNIQSLMADTKVGDWNPTGVSWADPGNFFNEAGEYFDPVQGAVGDCYFIAGLSSVAWADPYCISHRARATGTSQQQFVDKIDFYKSPGKKATQIEVTEAMPLRSGSHGWIYCRSSERNEIWPAVYEKAYAKWKTNDSSDRPNITSIAGGDPVRACSELNGKKRYYYSTQSRASGNLWSLVRGNSRAYRTFNPMVAWTYSSGQASPDKVRYADANLVANHAYSILGWAYRNNRKYIVLRNPWGKTEASINTMAGSWLAYDISWWRPIALSNPDGVFAIEAPTFKRYFAGLGTAK